MVITTLEACTSGCILSIGIIVWMCGMGRGHIERVNAGGTYIAETFSSDVQENVKAEE